MELMPGVIQDPTGGLHFHGGAEYQTRYMLDGFDISDPIDGRFRTMLAVEGVRSLDLYSSRESPEYGRGSGGTMQVDTDNGTDQLRYTATNFIPGLTTNGGIRIGDWTPRAGISGPIVKGRAWFSDSFNGEYNGGYVTGLPAGREHESILGGGESGARAGEPDFVEYFVCGLAGGLRAPGAFWIGAARSGVDLEWFERSRISGGGERSAFLVWRRDAGSWIRGAIRFPA